MRQGRLAEAIQRVTEVLEETEMRDALSGEAPDPERLLEALRGFSLAAAAFDEPEALVLDLLGLGELASSSVWARLLAGGEARRHYHERLAFVSHHLPRFVELLEETGPDVTPERTLEVTLVEETAGASATTVVTVVNAVNTLYRTCAQLAEREAMPLALVHCDTHGEAVLLFDGEEDIVGATKAVLIAAYRWLALCQHEALEQRIELARGSLPTSAGIEARLQDGTLTADVADAVDRGVMLALLAFFDAGAIIPELDASVIQSPREVVSQRPRDIPRHSQPPLFSDLASEIASLDSSPGLPPSEHQTKHDSIIELEPSSVELTDEP